MQPKCRATKKSCPVGLWPHIEYQTVRVAYPTWLIDALYEHKVKLICTAEVPAQELYTTGEGSFEFERTVSRLIDMQSESYLHIEHGVTDCTMGFTVSRV